MANIVLKPIRAADIPKELREAFVSEVQGMDWKLWNKWIRCPIKFGAYNGERLIGFMFASPWKKWLNIVAPFVLKEYRGKKVGSRLFFRMLMEAKKMGKTGVQASRAGWDSHIMFARAVKTLGGKVSANTFWDRIQGWCWDITFNEKRQRPGAIRNPKNIPRRRA